MFKHNPPLCSIFYWFHPCGVAVNIMGVLLVSVYLTGSVWEFTCMICVHGIFHVVFCYQYVMNFLRLVVGFVFNGCLGGF